MNTALILTLLRLLSFRFVDIKSCSGFVSSSRPVSKRTNIMSEFDILNPVIASMSAPDLSKLKLLYASSPPSLAESFVSDDEREESKTFERPSSPIKSRRKLQWEFKGLTIWLELEEFDNDLTKAVSDFSEKHNSPFIPKPHTTAIYGMEHLSIDEAKAKLQTVRERIEQWPAFSKPTGVTSDIAQVGRPGQVCSIAWSELTLSSNEHHEAALDVLYELFYGEQYTRDRPWKPHNSIAYDNPEDNTLSLLDTVTYVSRNPTLLGKERRVEAISLWSTVGKMEDWVCLERVKFW